MASAENAVRRVFFRDVAWSWPDFAEASARFAEPVAELDRDVPPSRVLSLKEVSDRVAIPPGPPRIVENVWLCYPGRRHVISASASTPLIDPGDNPSFGIGKWVFLAVDSDEREPDGPVQPVPPHDRVPLVVDGVELKTWYHADGGLCCRAALAGDVYYAAICLAGEARAAPVPTPQPVP